MRNLISRSSALRPVRLACGGLVLSILLLACQPRSPEEELLKAVEPVGSWLATLQMTGQKWIENAVPASFVRNTAAAALEIFDKTAEEASKSEARPSLREPIRGLLAEARTAAAGLRSAADAGDRPAMGREVRRFAALHARLESLTKPGSGTE